MLGCGFDMVKSSSTGLGMHLCTVMCQLLEHPGGLVWFFCLCASSVQHVVVPVSLVCSVGLGMLLLLTKTVVGGFII